MSEKKGLKLVSNHEIQNNKAIIFIHGLNGHELNTWRKKNETKDEQNLSLPELFSTDIDFSQYDVYTFSYSTGFFLKQYDVDEISRLLETAMRNQLHGKNHVFFVTHSQGGLVARQLINHLLTQGKKEEVDRIEGVVYFAVPFAGATLGSYAKVFSEFIPAIFGKYLISVQVISLAIFHKQLGLLQESWKSNMQQRKLPNLREKAIIALKDTTVSSFSAKPDYVTDIEEVDENHTSICKFDKNHFLYGSIKRFITLNKTAENHNLSVEKERTLIIKADEYFRISNYKKALKEYIKLVGKLRSKEMQIYIRIQQGLCHYHLSKESKDKMEDSLKNSIQNYMDAIKIADKDKSYTFFNYLGDAYLKLATIRNAVENLEYSKKFQMQALEICNKDTHIQEYLEIKNSIAVTYLDIAEYENTENNIAEALRILEEIADYDKLKEILAYAVLTNIGRCYEKLSNVKDQDDSKICLKKAIECYGYALEIVTVDKYPEEYRLVKNNLGNAYIWYSQLTEGTEEVEKALDCFNDVFEISKKDTNSFDYCFVLHNLGLVHFQLYEKLNLENDLKKSIEFYEKSLKYKEIYERPITHARTQFNLGISLLSLFEIENKEKDLNAAIKAFEQSIKLSSKLKNINFLSNLKLSVANIMKGQFKKNCEYIYQAISNLTSLSMSKEIYFKSNNIQQYLFSNLLDAYFALIILEKDKSKLKQTLKDGNEFFQSYKYNYGVACIHHMLGDLYQLSYEELNFFDQSILEEAINHFSVAANFYKLLEDPHSTSVVLFWLSWGYQQLYCVENNLHHLNKARDIIQEALTCIETLLENNNDDKYKKHHNDVKTVLSEIEQELKSNNRRI